VHGHQHRGGSRGGGGCGRLDGAFCVGVVSNTTGLDSTLVISPRRTASAESSVETMRYFVRARNSRTTDLRLSVVRHDIGRSIQKRGHGDHFQPRRQPGGSASNAISAGRKNHSHRGTETQRKNRNTDAIRPKRALPYISANAFLCALCASVANPSLLFTMQGASPRLRQQSPPAPASCPRRPHSQTPVSMPGSASGCPTTGRASPATLTLVGGGSSASATFNPAFFNCATTPLTTGAALNSA